MPKLKEGRSIDEPHLQPGGFESIMRIGRLFDNVFFGKYLDECEVRGNIKVKILGNEKKNVTEVIIRVGNLKFHIPPINCLVQFPKCETCNQFYLGHDKFHCNMCRGKINQRLKPPKVETMMELTTAIQEPTNAPGVEDGPKKRKRGRPRKTT